MTLTEHTAWQYIFRRPVTGSRPTAKNFDASNRSPLANKERFVTLLNNGLTGTGSSCITSQNLEQPLLLLHHHHYHHLLLLLLFQALYTTIFLELRLCDLRNSDTYVMKALSFVMEQSNKMPRHRLR